MRRNLVANMTSDAGTFMVVKDAGGKTLPASPPSKEKPGHIAISGFSHQSAAAKGDSALSYGPVRVFKSVGESTAVFLEAMEDGRALKQVDIVVYSKSGEGKESEELRISLEEVKVSSLQTRVKVGNTRLPNTTLVEEEVVLEYKTITWMFEDGTSSFRAER